MDSREGDTERKLGFGSEKSLKVDASQGVCKGGGLLGGGYGGEEKEGDECVCEL